MGVGVSGVADGSGVAVGSAVGVVGVGDDGTGPGFVVQLTTLL